MGQIVQIGFGVLVAVLTAMALSQAWMLYRSRRAVGQPAPPLGSLGPAPASGSALVYFYSPTCGPCRAMAPGIDALAAEGFAVHKIDVTRTPEVAQAYGVMATPTTTALRDGTIRTVMVGVVSRERLRALLV